MKSPLLNQLINCCLAPTQTLNFTPIHQDHSYFNRLSSQASVIYLNVSSPHFFLHHTPPYLVTYIPVPCRPPPLPVETLNQPTLSSTLSPLQLSPTTLLNRPNPMTMSFPNPSPIPNIVVPVIDFTEAETGHSNYRWDFLLAGHFRGNAPTMAFLIALLPTFWHATIFIRFLDNDFFSFVYLTMHELAWVESQGPWLIGDTLLDLIRWHRNIDFRRLKL